MHYKKNADTGNWIGYNNTSHGFDLFESIPDSSVQPDILEPNEIDDSELADIPYFFRLLSENGKNWWTNFLKYQSFDTPMLPEISDTWLALLHHDENFSDAETLDTPEEAPIVVRGHQVSGNEFQINDTIAIWADPSGYEEPNINWWIGKVKQTNILSLTVQWYERKQGGKYNELDTEEEIPLQTVIRKISLKKNGEIYAVDLKKIVNS